MLTVYHCNTSYASQKLRLYLAEKKVSWQSHHIDLRKQENITSDYRTINPKGTVPAMRDENDEMHLDSTDIMEYMEWRYPHPYPNLSTDNIDVRAKIHALCLEHETLHDPYVRTLSYANIFFTAEKRKHMDIEKVLKLAKEHPNPARGKFLEKAAKGEFTDAEIKACHNFIDKTLDHLETYLQASCGNFIFADTYTIADAVATASVYRICEIQLEADVQKRKLVWQWYQQMQQRPSYKEAMTDWLAEDKDLNETVRYTDK